MIAISRRFFSNGHFKLPLISNEPMKSFAPGSNDRVKLLSAIEEMKSKEHFVPLIINGKEEISEIQDVQAIPSNHAKNLCKYSKASTSQMRKAIEGALIARDSWQRLPFEERASIFLKAAEIISSTDFRYRLMAATMLGQGKNIWQAEIDSICELVDFLRFNCRFAEEIYSQQPIYNSTGTWNRVEYRPLEGFIYAVSPFNFTAIGGNLACAPALMGNVVIWKPSNSAIFSNYLIMQALLEAGLPPGVIQFTPGSPEGITDVCLGHKQFAGLHFTGSSRIFSQLWKQIGNCIEHYRSYPRIVGETGGKNMHFVHSSADPINVVNQTIRAAFEYQGQKCSACSRVYIPESLWPQIKAGLIDGIKSIKMGPVEDPQSFLSAVISKSAFDRIRNGITRAIDPDTSGLTLLAGGNADESVGWFLEPTLIQVPSGTKAIDAKEIPLLNEELFGPVLAVVVYPDEEYEIWLKAALFTSNYALTAGIFARDRNAIMQALDILKDAAGNVYINDKCTGAVVGQQPFGGSRASGTNDKAGSAVNLLRWTSQRSIKENWINLSSPLYPSNYK